MAGPAPGGTSGGLCSGRRQARHHQEAWTGIALAHIGTSIWHTALTPKDVSCSMTKVAMPHPYQQLALPGSTSAWGISICTVSETTATSSCAHL